MAQSELTQLRQRIERECEALYLLKHGVARAASHDVIQHKYRQLGVYQQQLGTLVGEQEAIEVMYQVYTRVIR